MSVVFSSSLSLAAELVSAVLSDTVFEWCSRRWVPGLDRDIYKLFFCNSSRHREDAGRKILAEFAESVRGMRITSIIQNRLVEKGDEHSEGKPVRLIDFAIGRDGNESVVVMRVTLHEQYGDPLVSVLKKQVDHWSSWQPAIHNAVECIKHPNKKLEGCIVLGRLAAR